MYEAYEMQVNSEWMAKFYLPTIQSFSFYLPWLIALILWLLLLRSLKKSEKDFQASMRDPTLRRSLTRNNPPSISNYDSIVLTQISILTHLLKAFKNHLRKQKA